MRRLLSSLMLFCSSHAAAQQVSYVAQLADVTEQSLATWRMRAGYYISPIRRVAADCLPNHINVRYATPAEWLEWGYADKVVAVTGHCQDVGIYDGFFIAINPSVVPRQVPSSHSSMQSLSVGVLHHELGHALGLWDHTTRGVMQPVVASDFLDIHSVQQVLSVSHYSHDAPNFCFSELHPDGSFYVPEFFGKQFMGQYMGPDFPNVWAVTHAQLADITLQCGNSFNSATGTVTINDLRINTSKYTATFKWLGQNYWTLQTVRPLN